MGISSSKAKSQRRPHPLHVPKGYYPYEHSFPPNYWPPPPMPPYGYGQQGFMPNHGPVIPPGFMPQYAPQMPQMPMPQPQPYWPPQAPQPTQEKQRKPKKSRKRRTPTATLTFSRPRNVQGPPSAEPTTATSAQPTGVQPHENPLTTASTTNYSAGVPPQPQVHTSHHPQRQSSFGRRSDNQHADPSPSRPSHDRRASAQSQASRVQSHPGPIVPPTQATFQHRIRAPNPLPEPPRDIYLTSPYKHLLVPKALPTLPTVAQTIVVKQEDTKQPKKGLFSALRRKKSAPKETQEVRYIFAPQGSSSFVSHVSPAPSVPQASPAPRPPSPPHSAVPSQRGSVLTHNAPEPEPEPEPEPRLPPIYFDQDTEYAPFLNHSPHNVSYERVDYPTATHLLEALKFMPLRPDIAEAIRLCEDTADVYEISAEHGAHQAPGFGTSYLEMMEMVAYIKFNQHAELRDLLLSTDDAPLMYDDPSDSYWGIGASMNGEPGQNELGHVLERVRARFRQDRLR